jgi:hypothetical protein
MTACKNTLSDQITQLLPAPWSDLLPQCVLHRHQRIKQGTVDQHHITSPLLLGNSMQQCVSISLDFESSPVGTETVGYGKVILFVSLLRSFIYILRILLRVLLDFEIAGGCGGMFQEQT